MPKSINRNLYLTVTEAAKRLDISRMTMHRWVLKGMAPTGEKLDVIQDKWTGQYLIPENVIRHLCKPKNRYQPLAAARTASS
jgi:predicted site-specific integrase-resolvase